MKIKRVSQNANFLNKILMANVFDRKYPINVTYICTYKCNFNCKYCSVYKNKEKEMSTEEAKKMMDQLKEMGTKRFSFNGGEPLLKKDIGELIDYAKSKGFITTVFTNGSLVKEKIEEIKNIDVMLISLDGPAEIHDGQRFKGAYKTTIEAIKVAKSKGINVWTNTVITKHNLDYIDFILDKARELGTVTIYQPVLEYSHASEKGDIEKLTPLIEKYEKTIDKLIKRKKEGGPIFHSVNYLKYIKNPNWSLNKRKCWAGKLYCAIKPNGDVAPCYPIFMGRKWPNGLKMGFEKAFKSLRNFSCNGCYCILAENDFLFSLRPETIYNVSKFFK